MKEFLRTTKGKIAACGVCVVVVVAIVAVILAGRDGYRSISVEDVKGNVNVVGERNNGQAYKGQRLYSGDDVTVMKSSELTMCMDNDKYVYADENTHFWLEASSPKESSRIRIHMDKGSELNILNAKLGIDDTYEVDTPNSTMSVRGTTFRVTVYMGGDGFVYTLLEVTQGRVLCRLKTATGAYNGVEREFGPGESALIRGNDDLSEFVLGDDGLEIRHLDYDNLPKANVPRLIKLLMREGVTIDQKDIEEYGVETDDEDSGSDEGKNPDDGDAASDKAGGKKPGGETLESAGANNKDSANNSAVQTPAVLTNAPTLKAKPTPTPSVALTPTSTPKPTPTPTPIPGITPEPTKDTSNDTGEGETKKPTKAVALDTQAPTAAPQPTDPPEPTSHTHSYSWVVTTQATCGRDGEETGTCSCGDVQKRSIPATGQHTAGGWTVQNDATCTSEGTEVQSCSVCGVTMNTRSIAKKDHNINTDKQDPSCTTDGYTRTFCTECGQVLSQNSIPALGHEKIVDKSIQTHVAYICARCGVSLND